MRQSDAAAALAILCGTLIGAEIFRQANAPQASEPTSHVRIVEVRAEPTPEPEDTEAARKVALHIDSVDPDRQAHLQLRLEGYPEGKTTDVVTPFTLISTREALRGTLTTRDGDPEVRVELKGRAPGTLTAVGAAATGSAFLIDSSDGLSVQEMAGRR